MVEETLVYLLSLALLWGTPIGIAAMGEVVLEREIGGI